MIRKNARRFPEKIMPQTIAGRIEAPAEALMRPGRNFKSALLCKSAVLRKTAALLRGPAAVDREVGAGDLRRVVAAQEQRECRHLLRGDELFRRLRRQQCKDPDEIVRDPAERIRGLASRRGRCPSCLYTLPKRPWEPDSSPW